MENRNYCFLPVLKIAKLRSAIYTSAVPTSWLSKIMSRTSAQTTFKPYQFLKKTNSFQEPEISHLINVIGFFIFSKQWLPRGGMDAVGRNWIKSMFKLSVQEQTGHNPDWQHPSMEFKHVLNQSLNLRLQLSLAERCIQEILTTHIRILGIRL